MGKTATVDRLYLMLTQIIYFKFSRFLLFDPEGLVNR